MKTITEMFAVRGAQIETLLARRSPGSNGVTLVNDWLIFNSTLAVNKATNKISQLGPLLKYCVSQRDFLETLTLEQALSKIDNSLVERTKIYPTGGWRIFYNVAKIDNLNTIAINKWIDEILA